MPSNHPSKDGQLYQNHVYNKEKKQASQKLEIREQKNAATVRTLKYSRTDLDSRPCFAGRIRARVGVRELDLLCSDQIPELFNSKLGLDITNG